MTDGRNVSYDRWDATNQEINRRLGELEAFSRSLRGAEQEHRSFEDRLLALERSEQEAEAGRRSRRDRSWVVGLTIMSAMISPIVVSLFIAWLHVRG